MIKIGEYNNLQIDRREESGFYLEDDEGNSVLLPNAYIEPSYSIGDTIKVFIYLDSEDRIIATNLIPKVTLGKFAYLAVKEVNEVGAFLDMGLAKDLLVPFRQQASDMIEGKSYLVYLYLDETTNRLIASSKINQRLNNDSINLMEGEQVDLIIANKTDLGYNVIVNEKHKGLIFNDAIFQEINVGDELKGFVKTIRDDNKIDILLHQQGVSNFEPNAQKIITFLKQSGGSSNLTDSSSPEEIYKALGMSKKTFKKALGLLYKKRMVKLSPGLTELV